MAGFLTLLRIRLKLDFSFSAIFHLQRTKSKAAKVGVIAALILAFGELYAFYLIGIYSLSDMLIKVGQQDAFLSLVTIAVMCVVLIFGIFNIISVLYFSKDLSFLTALPVSPQAIFASKLTSSYLFELIFAVPFFLPALLMFGLKTGASPLLYLRGLVVMLLLPALPLAVATLLSMLLMRLTALFKRRDMITTVGGTILLLLLIVGIQFFNRLMMSVTQQGTGTVVAQQSLNLAKLLTGAFPPALWAVYASAAHGLSGFLYFLLFTLLSVGSLTVICGGASLVYYRSISGLFEQSAGKSRGKKAHVRAQRSSAVVAIFKKEWKMLLRVPIYALNGLTGIIIVPIMMVSGGITSTSTDAELQVLFKMMHESSGLILGLILSGVFAFIGAINPAAATVFSREGDTIHQLLSLPVSIKTITKGKLLFSYSIALPGILLSAIAVTVFFKLSVLVVGAAVLAALLASSLMAEIAVYIDLLSPKLKWNSPTEAIKQNMNVVISMCISMALLIPFGVLSFLMISLKWAEPIVWAFMFLLLAGLSAGVYALLMKLSEKHEKKGFPV